MKSTTTQRINDTGTTDAVAMLTADHKKVKSIFKQFESLKSKEGSSSEKSNLVTQVCQELKIHVVLEEELFYPAVRRAVNDEDLIDEALVEHASAKDLIAQLEAMQPEDALYDAKVTVLGEQIEHHAKEEEDEMFPKAKKAKLDMAAVGAEMAARRAMLMQEGDKPHAKRSDSHTSGRPLSGANGRANGAGKRPFGPNPASHQDH